MSKSSSKIQASRYEWKVEVRSPAHLDEWINDYFDGLTLSHEEDGSSLLRGALTDLPAVYGLILKLRDSGIELLSLKAERMQAEEEK